MPASGGAGGSAGADSGTDAGGDAPAAEAGLPDPTGFRATGAMNVARRTFTATLLADGRVLVVGGEQGNPPTMIDGVEIFDPSSETWTNAASLPEPRANHTATLLSDGRVLVAGGGPSSMIGNPSGVDVVATALLFDPIKGTWAPTGSMKTARAAHQARRLPDGKILVAGGGLNQVWDTCAPQYPGCTIPVTTDTAEIYDPAAGQFTETDAFDDGRMTFTLTPLDDGSLLAMGGFGTHVGVSLKTGERFDPIALTWKPAGELTTADRLHHAAARLGSGTVLVAGGKKANVAPQKTSEIFDPATTSWSQTGPLSEPRTGHLMFELPSGRVLVAGGYNQYSQSTLDLAAIFDEATGQWAPIGPLTTGRSLFAGARLDSGRVVVCGGSTPIYSHTESCDISE